MHKELQRYRRITFVLGALLCMFVLLFFFILFDAGERISDAPVDNASSSSEDFKVPESPYLSAEEVVIIESEEEEEEETILPVEKVLFEYVKVVDGCDPYFEGGCLNVRSGPSTEYPVIRRLRNGMVLKVGGRVENEGRNWYKIVFDEWIRYPNRVEDNWYVAAEYVEVLLDEGDKTAWENEVEATGTQKIIVDLSEQKLYAYEGEELFMEATISTGVEFSPTPRGTFSVFKKTPSRYMQGPIPGITEKYYDLPGVPWNLYFTYQGAVIHGTYWHDNFGRTQSNGCVNLTPDLAKKLYDWANLGIPVVVRD